MIVYRLAAEPYVNLSGEGARQYPGRWNEKGIPCLYTSESASAATLEVLVNTGDWRVFTFKRYKLMHIHLPDSRIMHIRETELPKDWNELSISDSTRAFGAVQLKQVKYMGFSVPSVVAPLERNVILNTAHPDFKKEVKLKYETPFRFDQRLLR